jgi:topoisomerase-4 subunit A
MLQGIDEDAIDFRDNYDGTEREPELLPAAVPNLLANGSSGIAVGMATNIPPHNLGEICDALLHLIKSPNATNAKLVDLVKGPDFPTGGVLAESKAAIEEAYATGRGSLRLRARWEVEKLKHGQYVVVVTEIPYLVQKSRIVEKIAELVNERKLPLLADVRDESTDVIRLVLEPKNRSIEPEVLIETLFRSTDLETRFGVNLNVLGADRVPKVMNLRELLRAYLDHRHEVLKRRTKFRLGKIEARLEILAGFLIAYLNIDEVIRIIREHDDPKPRMMKKWKLTDVQADAILNMRLRSLRKLEEIEIKKEHEELEAERKTLARLLKDEDKRWAAIADEVKTVKEKFGPGTPGGNRRTEIGAAPGPVDVSIEVMVEREPVTVVCSDKGWIRAIRGHLTDYSDLKYKEGDKARFAIHAQTTDKLVVFGTNGRCYTLGCDKLPGGRGNGEPVRLMIDLGNDQEIVQLLVHVPGRKLLLASSDGRGFVVKEDDVLAQTRTGKQILNVSGGVEAKACVPVTGDSVAVVGENRKLVIFGLDEVPEMTRGRGVRLQKYKDSGLSDATVFSKAEGLKWKSGDRERVETDFGDWVGKRAQAGRLAPKGFASNNRFA